MACGMVGISLKRIMTENGLILPAALPLHIPPMLMITDCLKWLNFRQRSTAFEQTSYQKQDTKPDNGLLTYHL